MKHPETYLETKLEDIVFEDRNKAYGAYTLRRDTNRFLSIGLVIGFMFVTIISGFSLTGKKAVTAYEPEIFDTMEVEFLEKELPKPEVIVEQPAPQKTVQHATQAFLEMVVSNNPIDSVFDDVPKIEDLDPNIAIGLQTIKGTGGDPIIEDPKITVTTIIKEPDFRMVAEQMPEFIGGYIRMNKWLAGEIRYPEKAKDIGVEGTVYVSFIINTDGSIVDAKIERGIGFGCDEEALRAVGDMPNWIPGKQNGKAVRVKQTIPIKFELVND